MNRFAQCPQFPDKWKKITHINSSSSTIMSVISKAATQSTIILPPGKYSESIFIKNKDIHLIGEGNVTICPSDSGDAIIVENCNVFLTNIIIQTGKSQCASPINVIRGVCAIKKCILESEFMRCIVAKNESKIYCNECILKSKRSSVAIIDGCTKVEFNKCKISAENSIGLLASGKSQLRLIESELFDCGDSGIVVLDQASINVSNSKFYQNNGDAIELNAESISNVVLSTEIANHKSGSGLNCTGKGKLRIENCKIYNCICGLFCSNEFTIHSIQCDISNMISSALVFAISKSTICLTGDKLHGKCLTGIASYGQSSVKCEGVSFSDIETTGAVVNNSYMSLSRCKLNNIDRIGIEAKEDANLEIISTEIQKVGKVGMYLFKNVKGFFKDSTISLCNEANLQICDNNSKFDFSKSSFTSSLSSGVKIQDSFETTFSNCKFIENDEFGIEIKGDKTNVNFINCNFENNKLIGANTFDNACPIFDSCSFSNNIQSGAAAYNSSPKFNKCVFSNNAEIGFCALGGCQSKITNSIFTKNKLFGSQIENKNTLITFNGCQFYDQIETGAIILNDYSSANILDCIIHDNNGPHIECRENSKVMVEDSDLYSSKSGIGIMILDKGFIKISHSKLHNETQASIVIDYDGDCEVDQCEILNCDICGIYFLKNSNGKITNNKIHDNKFVGIHVTGASPIIQSNVIENHSICGIRVTEGNPEIGENIYSGNQSDVA